MICQRKKFMLKKEQVEMNRLKKNLADTSISNFSQAEGFVNSDNFNENDKENMNKVNSANDDPDQADARRAEIILNGLSADVVRSVENGKVWYRVVSGPYDSAEAAIIAQQTLQNSGIDSIVVKR